MYIKGHFITWDKFNKCIWFDTVKVFTDTEGIFKTPDDIKNWMLLNIDKHMDEWINHKKLMAHADNFLNNLY